MYEVVAIYSKREERADELVGTCKKWEDADILASYTSCNAHVHAVDVFWVCGRDMTGPRGYIATYKSGYKM